MLDFPTTLGLMAAAACLAAFCGWRGARPSDPSKGARMIPWRALMVAAAVAAFLMLVHLANLSGLETGRR